MTTIISNGSKWNGQKPDSISKLLEVLKDNTIEEMFFGKSIIPHSEGKKFVSCPIRKEKGIYYFFGNFEEVSHVFNIETTDKGLISKLRDAIMNNAGWKKYISLSKRVQK